MGFLGVIGVILIAVGFLALFGILSLSQPIALVFVVVGMLLIVFGGRNIFTRR